MKAKIACLGVTLGISCAYLWWHTFGPHAPIVPATVQFEIHGPPSQVELPATPVARANASVYPMPEYASTGIEEGDPLVIKDSTPEPLIDSSKVPGIEVPDRVEPADIAGRYYSNYIAGYELVLDRSGEFESSISYCLGRVASTRGVWHVREDRTIHLEEVAGDTLIEEQALQQLSVLCSQGDYFLLPPKCRQKRDPLSSIYAMKRRDGPVLERSPGPVAQAMSGIYPMPEYPSTGIEGEIPVVIKDPIPEPPIDYSTIPGIEVPDRVEPSDLVGEYTTGVNTGGYNLTLRQTGEFECVDWCCLGFDKVVGRWQVSAENKIILDEGAGGTLVNDKGLHELIILRHQGDYLLLPPRWGKYLASDGRLRGFHFHRDPRQGVLEASRTSPPAK